MSACPHRQNVEESNMTVHITLLTGKSSSGIASMVFESLGRGILDSACTKTVAGSAWMEEFLNNLNDDDQRDVLKSTTAGVSLFRFGDGAESRSQKCVTIPVFFGKKRKLIEEK